MLLAYCWAQSKETFVPVWKSGKRVKKKVNCLTLVLADGGVLRGDIFNQNPPRLRKNYPSDVLCSVLLLSGLVAMLFLGGKESQIHA